jgi:poly(hydroxyalkanoate) depolymerase family esterase
MVLLGMNVNGQRDMLEIKNFGSNPGNLKMFLYEPKIAAEKHGKLPLVIALHGCTQSAASMAKESGWNELAETYGFYVIYPQQKTLNNPSNCFNWFEEGDNTKDKGEVFSIKQMIDYATDSLMVDTNRVFVYGLSAGAAMGVALMADYPYQFNMGAILAGGPYTQGLNVMNAISFMENPKDAPSQELAGHVIVQNPDYKGKYPKMIIMQGEKDMVVNSKNAYLLIKQWAPLLRCDTVPTKNVPAFDGKADISRKAYCDASGTEQIIFYDIANFGHALMVAPNDTTIAGGGRTGMFSIDKGFFSTYWIAVDMGLISPPLSPR